MHRVHRNALQETPSDFDIAGGFGGLWLLLPGWNELFDDTLSRQRSGGHAEQESKGAHALPPRPLNCIALVRRKFVPCELSLPLVQGRGREPSGPAMPEK